METSEPDIGQDQLPIIPGYDLLALLGQGGMGAVYRARQLNLDRLVALKTVQCRHAQDAKMLARFEQEARSVARLRHPNIVTAFDFGRHGDHLYFVMELLEGSDLEVHLRSQGPLDEFTTLGILRQAAAGLAHALQQGLIHRDVKPANMILVPPPEGLALPPGLPLVKITDFGLALLVGDDESAPRLTRTNVAVGSPLYMAPEQFTNQNLDCRTDIYALGISACQALTGKPPYRGKSVWEIMAAKDKGILPVLPDHLSPACADLLRQMVARDPEQRIPNYSELIQRIDQILSPSGTTLRVAEKLHSPEETRDLLSATRPEQAGVSPSARRWPKFVGLGLGVIPLLVLAFYLVRGFWVEPSPEPTLTPSGKVVALWTGESLPFPEWKILQGFWKTETDDEGGVVLSGQGSIRRLLPPFADFRLTMGVNLNTAQAVELHFGILEDKRSRYVLRLTPREILVGQRSDDAGEWRDLAAPRPLSPAGSGVSAYHELRVERQNAHWFLFFQGRQIGVVPVLGPEVPEFRLFTESGPVFFESIEVVELVPPEKARSVDN